MSEMTDKLQAAGIEIPNNAKSYVVMRGGFMVWQFAEIANREADRQQLPGDKYQALKNAGLAETGIGVSVDGSEHGYNCQCPEHVTP